MHKILPGDETGNTQTITNITQRFYISLGHSSHLSCTEISFKTTQNKKFDENSCDFRQGTRKMI